MVEKNESVKTEKKERMKTIGVKASVIDDKIIDIRARQQDMSKSELYRFIIDGYFKKHPLTNAEKEIIASMVN